MNTRSTTQQKNMAKYSTSQDSDDHAQESYQLAHLPVLSFCELGSIPPDIGSLFGQGQPIEPKP